MEQKANMDPYSLAHLSEAQVRIDKALDAQFIYNAGSLGGSRGGGIFFLKEPQAPAPVVPQEP
jgi:hypothetical protein